MLPTTIHNTSIVPTTSTTAIGTSVEYFLTYSTVELWNVDDVYNWSLGNRQGTLYAGSLRDNHIDGRALIRLSYEDISNKMNIPTGPARNLYQDIQDLKYSRNVNWAYDKVTGTLEFISQYLPIEHLSKVAEYSIEGMNKVKGYSLVGYNKAKEYVPIVYNKLRGSNSNIFPDRSPLLISGDNNNNNNNNTTPGFEQHQLPLFNLPPPTTNEQQQQQQQQPNFIQQEQSQPITMYSNQQQFLQQTEQPSQPSPQQQEDEFNFEQIQPPQQQTFEESPSTTTTTVDSEETKENEILY